MARQGQLQDVRDSYLKAQLKSGKPILCVAHRKWLVHNPHQLLSRLPRHDFAFLLDGLRAESLLLESVNAALRQKHKLNDDDAQHAASERHR